MGALFGLLAAATYGAADFAGGLVSRRTNLFGVVLISQLIGAVPLLLVLPLFADAPPTAAGLGWGAAAGAAGATGVMLLYRGLAIGRMTVVAPVTAVVAAVAPVTFGLISGERPTALALLGVAIAFIAVALVSSAPTPLGDETDADATDLLTAPPRRGLTHALGAGVAFGAFFILLGQAGDDTGIWPLIATRAASVTLVSVLVVAARQKIAPAPGTMIGIATAGILDMSANTLYLLATRRGLLSLVAVLTSMYPASTVLLARFVLKERLVPTQIVGLLCAAASVALIVGG